MIKPKHYSKIIKKFLELTGQTKENFVKLEAQRENASGDRILIIRAHDDVDFASIEFNLKNDCVLLRMNNYMTYKAIKKFKKVLELYDK